MRIPVDRLRQEFKRVLLQLSFPEDKANICASIFASNSRDGVYSHGLNRFPVFVKQVLAGQVDPQAVPTLAEQQGLLEIWDGHLGPGVYNATISMNRAVELAKAHGIGCITTRNTNHWMRGGTYGWQAADAGCIGICFTNAIAGMPAWGGTEPVLGNNPLVIAVPRKEGHVVLDMAMSQFSYGKMQEYELRQQPLPVAGGYDPQGKISTDPAAIRQTKRALPAGYWKGSGLAMILDIVLVALSGGRSTADITQAGAEYGVTQCFISLYRPNLHEDLINAILQYVKNSTPIQEGKEVAYPGENTLKTRLQSEQEGVLIDETMWAKLLEM